MTREEILARSQKENKHMDEREKDVIIKAGNLSGAVSILLACLLMIFNELTNGPKLVTDAMWSVVFTGNAVQYGYQAYHLKKRSYWFLTVLMSAAGAVSIAAVLLV